MHVLIVEDEPDQAWVLGELLRGLEISSTVALGAAEALAKIERVRPDAAVLDLGMPRLDGFDLFRQLRARFPGLPTVLTTGFPASDLRVKAFLAAGRAAYLAKPIDMKRLTSILIDLVATHLPDTLCS